MTDSPTCFGVADGVALDPFDEEWCRDIDINLRGTFLSSQAAVGPWMTEQWSGTNINVSSISGIMGGPISGGQGARRSGPTRQTRESRRLSGLPRLANSRLRHWPVLRVCGRAPSVDAPRAEQR